MAPTGGLLSGVHFGGGGSSAVGNLPSPNFSDVPAFAEGGIVNRPIFGLLGEQGAEAVLPLSRIHDYMPAPQQQTAPELKMVVVNDARELWARGADADWVANVITGSITRGGKVHRAIRQKQQ